MNDPMHQDISGALRRFIGENFMLQEELPSFSDDAKRGSENPGGCVA